MRKLFTLLSFVLIVLTVNAQIPVTFTFEEPMADTAWRPFANNPDTGTIKIVPNPFINDVNGSDNVVEFTVRETANPWVGMYTDHLGGIIEFTEEAHTTAFMVYKSIISPMRMKFERSLNSGADVSTTAENTLTDDWELVSFDMTAGVGFIYQRLTIFPDFPAVREGGTVLYIDNIGNMGPDNTSVRNYANGTLRIYPNPVVHRVAVEYPEMTSIKVINLLGKTVESFTFGKANSKVIQLSDLESGMYFISVETSKGIYSAPFMKK